MYSCTFDPVLLQLVRPNPSKDVAVESEIDGGIWV